MPKEEFKSKYPSQYGSHSSMVVADETGEPIEGFEDLPEDMVVCEDDYGRYTTYKERLDNGLADARRWDRTAARKSENKSKDKKKKKSKGD